MADKKIEEKVLLTISEKKPEKGDKFDKNGVTIRVIQWIFEKDKGGVGGAVSLEKRQTYLGEDGEIKNGKAKGFTLDDMAIVKDKWQDIIKAMKEAPAPAFAEVGSDNIEEVPF